MTQGNDQSPGVLARIRMNFDSMSKSHQKVAEFLLTHGIDIVYLSANRIAEMIGVNPSTVVRTAKALGYEGFADLQAELQHELLRRTRVADRMRIGAKQFGEQWTEQPGDSDIHVYHRVVRAEITHTERLLHQVPVADFDQVVNRLDKAQRIYMLGSGISQPVLLHFCMLMRYIKPGYILVQAGLEDILAQLEDLTAQDVVFAMSHGRYVRYLLQVMDYARSIGAGVIALTDGTLSPLAKRADQTLIIPTRLWSVGHSIAMYAFFNALASALLLRNQETSQERLTRMDRIADQLHVFEDEE